VIDLNPRISISNSLEASQSSPRQNATQPSNPWILIPEPRPEARLRLFCLPYGGVGSAIYFPWLKHLPGEIELCLVRLPGRETRLKEPPFTHLAPLVEELAQVLSPYLERPFAVFGHSMGALIGFELVSHLKERFAQLAAHLFVSGRRPAHLPDPNPPIHALPDAALIQEVQQRYNGIPQVILQDEDLLSLFLPTLRADITLVETYSYTGSRLEAPISAFGGDNDNLVNVADLASWGDLTRAGFRLRVFPGDHFFIQSQQEALIQAMVSDLAIM